MSGPGLTPFDSIENAHHYVQLLLETTNEAKQDVQMDLAAPSRSDRRIEALHLVKFKLDKLEQQLQTTSRLLNDLRTLRRLLFDERTESMAVAARK